MTGRPGPRGPDDVVAVTGGQDRGARFGLRGSEATIGRGPVMDIVLTDPRVSRRHAVLRREEGAIVVEDLGSTTGTAVNGVPISAPTTIGPGDLVVIGDTELTVLGGPGHPAARPPDPPPPLPPPSPPPPPPAAAPVVARAAVLLPTACLALCAFALAGVWMPAFGDASGTDSVWTLGRDALRAQAIAVALLGAAAATVWLTAVVRPDARRARLPAAVVTALAGGLVAGLPFLFATVHTGDADREAGIALLAVAGVAIAACAVAGVVTEARDATPPPPGAFLLVGAGGAGGAILAAAAAPLPWVSLGDLELSGFDADLAAGGWLVPLALAAAAASVLALAIARAGETRVALAVAAGACASAAAALTFATTTAIAFDGFRMEIGLSLALTGASIALVSTTLGTLAAALPRRSG
jgi:hypothetical protein